MIECRNCRTWVRGQQAEKSARCPTCRLPLYEKPEGKRRPPPIKVDLGPCLLHAHNDAVGTCGRCGQLFCSICRTPWQDDFLCLACLNQALEAREPAPREVTTQRRQGMLSVVLAVVGWLFFIGSVALLWTLREGQGTRDWAIFTLVLFLAGFVPALLSLGQSAATIRSRGQRMTLATWALVLAGLQLGVAIAIVVVNITHN